MTETTFKLAITGLDEIDRKMNLLAYPEDHASWILAGYLLAQRGVKLEDGDWYPFLNRVRSWLESKWKECDAHRRFLRECGEIRAAQKYGDEE